jgi:hypothetical protein
MAEPKYTLNRTGAEVAEAITKALNSAQKATEPTTVVTGVDVVDNNQQAAQVYSARVIEDDTLELFAVDVSPTTITIYEAEDNAPAI